MNENIKDVLQTSGWYEGRKVDVIQIEKYLKESGYEMFSAVRCLEEFGMLQIVIPKPERLGEKEDRSHTNVEKAIANYYTCGSFDQEEKYSGERLVPVGQIRNEYQMLLVSESGKVYCNTGKLGDNFEQAWEAIITGKGFKAWGSF